MLDTSTSAFISHVCTYENMLTAKEIIARHGRNMNENALKFLIKSAEMYEPAGEDEENAYNVEITEDMNREDVIQKILKIADNLEEMKVETVEEEKYMP